jgi:Zn-dependent metalloprotease
LPPWEVPVGKIPKVKAKVDSHPGYGVPQRVYDIESSPSKAKPAQIAAAFLKKIARSLKIKPDLSQLKFDKVKDTLLGSHVLYQQYHGGKAISGAWIRVDIDKDGRVYNVQNDLVPEPALAQERRAAKAARAVSDAARPGEDAVKALAIEAVASNEAEVVEIESCYFPQRGVPRAAWKVVVVARKPRGDWKLYIDAETGEVLEKTSLLKQATGKGRVFDPNPVARLNDTSLEDSSPIPGKAYLDVPLPDLADSGFLDGPFVTTSTTSNRVRRKNRRFLFKRTNRAFKEVMAYFHIDRVQRHLQALGFDNVLSHAIRVDVDGTVEDNSFYSPVEKGLTFGTGGVDDAEDAEIILHEYGHAIQDDQVPGFGTNQEGRAMGEGFGDFLAASFFSDVKPASMKPTVGNWDAVAYSGDEPPNLRRLDSNKKFPRDVVGEEHADGEIWSACLWELRAALGRQAAERLVVAHHFLLTRFSRFEDAAKALIAADQNLNGGANQAAVQDVFVRRGILPNAKRGGKRAGEPYHSVTPNRRGR